MAAALKFTPVGDIKGEVDKARATFASGKTRDLSWRRAQLQQIVKLVEENTGAMTKALKADLRRPDFECVVAEALTVIGEARHALRNLSEWTAPTTVTTPAAMLPGSSWTQAEPLGVATIIAPWNFPIQLLLNPLVGALAAGCTAVLKPSELAPHSAVLLQELVARYLDADAVRVVQGAVPETAELLAQRVDVIMYTGNAQVARVVAAAAAKHLTPLILELGGKCPTVVAADADLELAAKRILGWKFTNAGQVCLAPDYVLVEAAAEAPLLAAMTRTLAAFYGPDPQASDSLGRIVNGRHWERIMGYLKDHGGKVVAGGTGDASDLYVAPTIISRPSTSSALMTQEIFGPVLPVLPVASVDEAVEFINAREKPLAVYAFSQGRAASQVLARTSSGAAAVNECVMQTVNCDLPFGGVGEAGMGSYHGLSGFRSFSHIKACYRPSSLVDMAKLRYPPYTAGQLKMITRMLLSMPTLPKVGWRDVLIGGLVVAVAVLGAKLREAGG